MDGRDVQSVGQNSLDQHVLVLIRPVVPLLGVEVEVVEGVIFVADFGS